MIIYDVKPGIYSRNFSQGRSSYTEVNKIPGSHKAMKFLRLTESSLLPVSFNLMAGDINPQPGPAGHEVPTLNFKADRAMAFLRAYLCMLIQFD